MSSEKNSRIRKVQKFGGFARGVCTLLLAFVVLLAAPWGLFSLATMSPRSPIDVDLGILQLIGVFESPAYRLWLLVVFAVVFGLFVALLWSVRGVFVNLAGGVIYSRTNVRLLQRVAWLIVAAAGFQVVAPMVMMLLETSGVIDAGKGPFSIAIQTGGVRAFLSAMVTAGILLLVSWVTDIGLGLSNEAEDLRRDAELII